MSIADAFIAKEVDWFLDGYDRISYRSRNSDQSVVKSDRCR